MNKKDITEVEKQLHWSLDKYSLPRKIFMYDCIPSSVPVIPGIHDKLAYQNGQSESFILYKNRNNVISTKKISKKYKYIRPELLSFKRNVEASSKKELYGKLFNYYLNLETKFAILLLDRARYYPRTYDFGFVQRQKQKKEPIKIYIKKDDVETVFEKVGYSLAQIEGFGFICCLTCMSNNTFLYLVEMGEQHNYQLIDTLRPIPNDYPIKGHWWSADIFVNDFIPDSVIYTTTEPGCTGVYCSTEDVKISKCEKTNTYQSKILFGMSLVESQSVSVIRLDRRNLKDGNITRIK